METLLTIESPELRYMTVRLAVPQPVAVPVGITAVTGPNGAGKSTLGRILERGWNITTNRITSPRGRLNVRMIEFADIHSLAGIRAGYYQQRYEATMNDDMPTVASVIGEERISTDQWRVWSDRLGLKGIDGKCVNFLSSGELRKVLLINQLVDMPDLLILDNPYIGLDADSRKVLNDTFTALGDAGQSVMLLLPEGDIVPEAVSHILYMDNMTVGVERDADAPEVIRMRGVTVRYGSRVIIDSIDWCVRRGERWLLTGANGSGKSTLLSLVAADNPQGYNNDIELFGRRRGSGESIWEIKRRIGYISPEMHLYFNGGQSTVLSVVAHGLHDTVGEFTKLREGEADKAMEWLEKCGIAHLADRRFATLSAGEQRMALLARTLIKNPELLILDEPMHGLDARNRARVRTLTERAAAGSTLIYVTHDPSETGISFDGHLRLP
ncbi:MAG: ATP-binding cassette domain-containing protein [Muribaculaceae bacterium]|nr:ATP-binding cassette domain-containing protein [Muribaculaceae bacterium]